MSISAPRHLEVVAAGGAGRPLLAQRGVLVGGRRIGRVRQRRQRGLQLGVGVRQLLRERLHPLGDLLHGRDLGRRVAALALGRADRLRGRVLLGLQRLDLGPQRAGALVELEHAVEPDLGPVTPPGQRRTHGLGVAPDLLEVEHRGYSEPPPPEYSATNSATFWASSPVTMFCGIGPRGEAAVADRVEHVLDRLLALVEVRAVARLARADVGRRPLRADHVERVALGAVLGEQARRPRSSGRPARRSMPSEPQAPSASAATVTGRTAKTAGTGHEARTAYGTIPPPMPLVRAIAALLAARSWPAAAGPDRPWKCAISAWRSSSTTS